MSRFRRIVDILGRVLIGAGVLLLLFAAYQLWGTSVEESHAQSALRSQLGREGAGTQAAPALALAGAHDALPTGPPKTAPSTADPPEGEPIGDIRIPAIGLDQVVVEGTGTADLRKGPGHYIGTPLPGQSGNAAVAGHRTTYGHPFYSLDALKVGDPVVVTTLQGVFVYDVTTAPFVVSPGDITVLENQLADRLTLTTCNPRFSASTRLVVQATLAHSRLFGANPSRAGEAPRARPSRREPTGTLDDSLAGDSSVETAATVGWGVVLVALGVLVFVGARQFRRRRWVVYGAGLVAALVVLWFFFGAVSPLLPASF